MKVFRCDACNACVYFENIQCLACGRPLGFLPGPVRISPLEWQETDGLWMALADRGLYRQCANATNHHVCNWMVPANESNAYCVSCRLDHTIPNLIQPGNLDRWRKLELAKRRVVYSLLELNLPFDVAQEGKIPGLRFSFLSDLPGQFPVLTSHKGGLITINIAEADDDERERRRIILHEPYRTIVGHFRHELGHYYWDRFIANTGLIEPFRRLFGDERLDYATALQAYYNQGPAPDWPSRCVSAYASAHPIEDFAETWAHYLHIIDTTETAAELKLAVHSEEANQDISIANPGLAQAGGGDFTVVEHDWFALTRALNLLNRGMGLPDLYPFLLSQPAIEKMRFVDNIVRSSGAAPKACNSADKMRSETCCSA
jgi:hypothetical protein